MSRRNYDSQYDTAVRIGIGGQVSKKDPILKEFAGYDLETALTKAALMAFEDELNEEEKKDLKQVYKLLDLQGKAYFMTEGSTELTKLLILLGDTRRKLRSERSNKQEQNKDD